MLFDVEGIIERGCVKAEGHEDRAEIALKVDGGVVAIGDRVLGVNRHLGEKSIGRSRSRSGSLRHFFLVLELKALKLGRDLEIKCAGGHVGVGYVESGNKFS